MARYTKEQSKQMKQVITNLNNANPDTTYADIASSFNEMGFKTTLGKEFDNTAVGNYLKHNMKKFLHRKKRRHKTNIHDTMPRPFKSPSVRKDDSLELAQIIMAAQLDDDKKKNLLKGIFA